MDISNLQFRYIAAYKASIRYYDGLRHGFLIFPLVFIIGLIVLVLVCLLYCIFAGDHDDGQFYLEEEPLMNDRERHASYGAYEECGGVLR
jgi:hypothetical protein